MFQYIILGYEILASFIPFLIVFIYIQFHKKKNGIPVTKYHTIIVFIVLAYIIGVYHFTGIGTIHDAFLYQLQIHPEQLNYIPFSQNVHFTSYVLNIILFVPLGFLVPVVWKKMDHLINTIGVGLIFTLFIELTQLLNHRITDIDDIILNVLGTIIGFVFFRVVDKITKSKFKVKDPIDLELMIYIVVITLGRFFFYNEMGLARLLFGF